MLREVVISCLLSRWRRALGEGSPCLALLAAAVCQRSPVSRRSG